MEPLHHSLLNRIGYRIFHQGYSEPGWERRKKSRRHEAERIAVLQQRPPALPTWRKNLSHTSLEIHPQPRCRLFTTIPLEIRQLVFELVLGGNVLHLTHIDKRIVHHRYPIPENTPDNEGRLREIAISTPPEALKRMADDKFSCTSLSLLHTCHVIYVEAIEILYRANIFSMSSPLVLPYLHDYTLRYQHLNQIQHLQLHWMYLPDPEKQSGRIYEPRDFQTWERFWGLVANLRLKTLGVWLDYYGEGYEHDNDWVRPMLGLRGLERVEVRVQSMWNPREWQRREELEERLRKVWTERRSAT